MSSRTFPRTMDRQDAEFSPDQRLAIYEKVMEKSEGQRRADQFDLELDLTFDPDKKDNEEKKEKSKTHAEVLAEMRDYRRRRQSYRAKNVHITKKSKTDVMRDIIDTHMKFLEDTLNSAKEEEEEEKRKRERTHSRSREGSSLSSRDARDHHRRRRSRSRDRSSRRDERSHSSSRSRDGKSHRHHSKHKHKSRHRSPTVEEFE